MRHALIAALLLTTAACAASTDGPQPSPPPADAAHGYDLAAQRAKIARIDMNPNTAFLNAEERDVVNLLIEAAELIDRTSVV
jgi:hypothetical protein